MNTLTVSVPDSLHYQLQKLADREGLSVDQLATAALAEKVSALMSTEYLSQRAQQGSRTQFDKVLAKVKDAIPEPGDEL